MHDGHLWAGDERCDLRLERIGRLVRRAEERCGGEQEEDGQSFHVQEDASPRYLFQPGTGHSQVVISSSGFFLVAMAGTRAPAAG